MLQPKDMYSEDATQYALNKLNVDWKEQALLKAKYYQEDVYKRQVYFRYSTIQKCRWQARERIREIDLVDLL